MLALYRMCALHQSLLSALLLSGDVTSDAESIATQLQMTDANIWNGLKTQNSVQIAQTDSISWHCKAGSWNICVTSSRFFGLPKAVGLSRHLASSEGALMAAAAELVEDLGAIFIGGAAASDGYG